MPWTFSLPFAITVPLSPVDIHSKEGEGKKKKEVQPSTASSSSSNNNADRSVDPSPPSLLPSHSHSLPPLRWCSSFLDSIISPVFISFSCFRVVHALRVFLPSCSCCHLSFFFFSYFLSPSPLGPPVLMTILSLSFTLAHTHTRRWWERQRRSLPTVVPVAPEASSVYSVVQREKERG